MRAIKFGKLSEDDWFVYNATPYRSGTILYKLMPVKNPTEEECVVPCINLLTAKVEYFHLEDVVLILDQEDIAKESDRE